MHELRRVLQDALTKASTGKLSEALDDLERGLAQARRRRNRTWTAQIARNAALISDQLGDLQRAEAYYQEAMQSDRSDPGLHYALGELQRRLGNHDLARKYFRSSYALARKKQDHGLLEVLDKMGVMTD
jgi:tetratricopeptide (TPR) repeat protein